MEGHLLGWGILSGLISSGLIIIEEVGTSVGNGALAVLPIRRGKRDNLGIISRNTPLKRMLRPVIRTISARRF